MFGGEAVEELVYFLEVGVGAGEVKHIVHFWAKFSGKYLHVLKAGNCSFQPIRNQWSTNAEVFGKFIQ